MPLHIAIASIKSNLNVCVGTGVGLTRQDKHSKNTRTKERYKE